MDRGEDYIPKRVLPPKGKPYVGIQGKSLHPNQFSTMVKNIAGGVLSASDDDFEAGKLWYPKAQEIAHEVGDGDIVKGAGIIAAVSPGTGWNENIRMARDIGRSGSTKGYITQNELGKARQIREGANPRDVLPMDIKTGHFFKNIVDPRDSTAVTIDRHAHDAAIGEKWGSRQRQLTGGRYQTFANAHFTATQHLNKVAGMEGLVPSEVQAVNWIHWRRKHGLVD
jgi:hypothetical protein